MVEHKLKAWPEPFEAVRSGRKTHEWRKDDRNYQVNDKLRLEEFRPCPSCNATGRIRGYMESDPCCLAPHGKLTGRSIDVYVTYVSRSPDFGIPCGWVVMSIGPNPVETPIRDPGHDPAPGDHLTRPDGEQAWVLEIVTSPEDCDEVLGPPPHVRARIDSPSGQRSHSVMSLATWRLRFGGQ